MTKSSNVTSRPTKAKSFRIGREASTNISRVEGLIVAPELKETFKSFDEKGLSHEARRQLLASKYGKKSR